MSLGKTIRRAREAQGFTLRKFAFECDISPTYLSMIEREALVPSAKVTGIISDKLNIDGDLLTLRSGKIPQWLKDMAINEPEKVLKSLK